LPHLAVAAKVLGGRFAEMALLAGMVSAGNWMAKP
jgi:hypothetical protein